MPRFNREYEKDLKATGNKVVIRKMERTHDRMIGDIYVATDADVNGRMTKGEIVSIGPKAKDKGFKEGDYILRQQNLLKTINLLHESIQVEKVYI